MRSNTSAQEDPGPGRRRRPRHSPEHRQEHRQERGQDRLDGLARDEAPAAARRSEAPRAPGLAVEALLDAGPRGARWLVRLAPDAAGRPAGTAGAPSAGPGPVWTARGRPPRRLVLRLAAGTTATGAAASPAPSSPRLDEELRALDAAVAGPGPAAEDGAEDVGDAEDAAGLVEATGRSGPAPPPVVTRHLVRTWGHVETSHGTGLLVDAEEAVPLSRLLDDRGTLAVGEVSTVLTPVAQLLAHLHRRGVAHGDVTPVTLLVAADGRPVLAELGDAQLLGHLPSSAGMISQLPPERRGIAAAADPAARLEALTAGQSPAADVHAMGALAWTALTGEPPGVEDPRALTAAAPQTPGSVARLVESAMAEAPEDRPSAAEFAAELYRAAAPQPVAIDERLVPTFPAVDDHGLRRESAPARRGTASPGDRRPRRRLVVGAATAAAALIVGGILWRTAAPGEDDGTTGPAAGEESDAAPAGPSTTSGDQESSPEAGDSLGTSGATASEARERARRQLRDDDVLQALEGVATLRTAALRGARTSEDLRSSVEEYAWPDSPAAGDERRMLGAMADRGLSYRGEAVRIEPMGEVRRLAVEDGEQARRAVDAQVRAEAFVPAEGESGADGEPLSQQVRLTMVRRDGVWKLHEVSRPPDAERSATTTGADVA